MRQRETVFLLRDARRTQMRKHPIMVGGKTLERCFMAIPKILIVTGDAAESLEVMYPYQRLKEEGYEVRIAGPSKKKLRFVIHDFEPGYDTRSEEHTSELQ